MCDNVWIERASDLRMRRRAWMVAIGLLLALAAALAAGCKTKGAQDATSLADPSKGVKAGGTLESTPKAD